MQPYVPFAPLAISPDAAIDLQTYTTLSDGYWTAPFCSRVWGEVVDALTHAQHRTVGYQDVRGVVIGTLGCTLGAQARRALAFERRQSMASSFLRG